MDDNTHYPNASLEYNSAMDEAIGAIFDMTQAMKDMAAEHANFHDGFNDVLNDLEMMKKRYGVKELDVEIIRWKALDRHLSKGNVPKVMAFGHLVMERVLKAFKEEEAKLENLQKETARRVEALVKDHGCKDGNGQSVQG